ncbi:MAG: glutamate 5-kinase [Alphaproteobacteria bacterium]|nr:glutamate 5-kinase [Alphaproteobacteria bacterium]
MSGRRHSLTEARRLVVKIGSALLADDATGEIRRDWLDALADDVAACRGSGQEVLIVSSGAIAVGRRELGFHASGPRLKALRLEENQAAAATGQIQLAHAFQESLARHDIAVAQILLTSHDTEERRRHLNARATIAELLRLGAVPVINENDTVATDEIRVGDNDRLAARVAQMISADTLVLLTDIDGLYTADPRKVADAEHIPEVTRITADIEAGAGPAPAGVGTGGMVTKLEAAKIAYGAGCRMVITDGRGLNPLAVLRDGAPCTWFLPQAEPLAARKRWIAGSLRPSGSLIIDDGAVAALRTGKSLLPAGVVAVEGLFERGDAVTLKDRQGREIGRGLSAYGTEDARRIAGYKSGEIERLLGYRGRDEMVHRDDLVITLTEA